MRITASDRSSLIRLASSLPAGSEPKRAILAGLVNQTMNFELSKTGSVVDKLEKLVGGDLKIGRNMIQGYPVDIEDMKDGHIAILGVDSEATREVLKILRREKFSVSFDKKDGKIHL